MAKLQDTITKPQNKIPQQLCSTCAQTSGVGLGHDAFHDLPALLAVIKDLRQRGNGGKVHGFFPPYVRWSVRDIPATSHAPACTAARGFGGPWLVV